MSKQIIITGNIGSGKSAVTDIFRMKGYFVISADVVSAKILEENHRTVSKMFSMPPQKFTTFKKTLSNLVFQRPEYLKELEDFMLPLIKQEIDYQCDALISSDRKFVVEMPTYFKNNPEGIPGDTVIIVNADKDIRVHRVLKRNSHLSIQDVLDRIRNQPDLRGYRQEKFAWTIDNNTSLEYLQGQVDEFIWTLEN